MILHFASVGTPSDPISNVHQGHLNCRLCVAFGTQPDVDTLFGQLYDFPATLPLFVVSLTLVETGRTDSHRQNIQVLHQVDPFVSYSHYTDQTLVYGPQIDYKGREVGIELIVCSVYSRGSSISP